jgi:aerobic carbon-monoxide dehydrogenase medium subunit
MYPPKFDYYRANSVDEALSLMKQHSEAKVLAGGHSLIPAMNLRLSDPGTLIDIGRIDSLRGITATRDGGCRIGALTPHAEVAKSDLVPTGLAEAAGMIGDPQVRNRGTVGGNIAHADPASDLPTVMTALKATIHLTGENGDREVAAADFFIDLFMTDLQPGELLTAVSIPSPHHDRRPKTSTPAPLPPPRRHGQAIPARLRSQSVDSRVDNSTVKAGIPTLANNRRHHR